jgi:hypothetical protein
LPIDAFFLLRRAQGSALRVPDYPEFGRATIRNGLALILDNRFYTLRLTAKARDVGRELVIA